MGKRNILGLILFIIYLGAVAYCCFGRFNDLPEVSTDSFIGIPMDKIVHFLMFFPFPILCKAFYSPGRKPRRIIVRVVIVFLSGCLIAAGTEVGQSFTDYRSGDKLDFMSDTLALAVSSVIVLAIDLYIKKHEKQIC